MKVLYTSDLHGENHLYQELLARAISSSAEIAAYGHIHESPDLSGAYVGRIGKTLSINPGQSIWTGRNVSRFYAVTFEMENLEETLTHTCLQQIGS